MEMEQAFPLETSWVAAVAAGGTLLALIWQLSRSIPLQNILMILCSVFAVEAMLEFVFVKYHWNDVDETVFTPFMLLGTLLWGTALLLARKVAQIILRPWRKQKHYGVWLILVSAVWMFCLQMTAVGVGDLYNGLKNSFGMSFIRAATSLVLLTALFPWFIRKKPLPKKEPLSEFAQEPQNETQ